MKARQGLSLAFAVALIGCSHADRLVGTYKIDGSQALAALMVAGDEDQNSSDLALVSQSTEQTIIELHADHTFFSGSEDHKNGTEGTWHRSRGGLDLIARNRVPAGRESTGSLFRAPSKGFLNLRITDGKLVSGRESVQITWSRVQS